MFCSVTCTLLLARGFSCSLKSPQRCLRIKSAFFIAFFIKVFFNFRIFGLQKPRSGFGFTKRPGSGFGFSVSGYETLVAIKYPNQGKSYSKGLPPPQCCGSDLGPFGFLYSFFYSFLYSKSSLIAESFV